VRSSVNLRHLIYNQKYVEKSRRRNEQAVLLNVMAADVRCCLKDSDRHRCYRLGRSAKSTKVKTS
jgi:hypothetical protein